MASCDNPEGIDEHNRGVDDDSDSSTDEAQTPRTRTKGKHKEVEGGRGSNSRKMTTTKPVAITMGKSSYVQSNLENL